LPKQIYKYTSTGEEEVEMFAIGKKYMRFARNWYTSPGSTQSISRSSEYFILTASFPINLPATSALIVNSAVAYLL
jgi:hypothetical protein